MQLSMKIYTDHPCGRKGGGIIAADLLQNHAGEKYLKGGDPRRCPGNCWMSLWNIKKSILNIRARPDYGKGRLRRKKKGFGRKTKMLIGQ